MTSEKRSESRSDLAYRNVIAEQIIRKFYLHSGVFCDAGRHAGQMRWDVAPIYLTPEEQRVFDEINSGPEPDKGG